MKLLRIIAAVVTALYFCSCQQNDIQIKQLTNIDSVADNDAERALNMLDSIAPYMKNATEASRNYYELLKIKAQDKAYIPQTSDSTITRLVEYYENKGDKRLLPKAYYYAGRIYMDINNVPEALKYLQKVTETGDHNNQLTYKAYSQIGYIFLYQELYDKGIEAFKKAYDYNRKMGNKNNQIHELCGIAECYNGKKQYTKALPYLKKALAISHETDYKMMYYAVLAQIANHYYNLKDYNSAKVYADKALNGVDSTNMRSVYSIAADIYNAKGLTDSAVSLYQKLYGLNDVYAKQFASKKLGHYYLDVGNPKIALYYLKRHETFSDSIQNIIQTQNIAKINALYNYQLKDKENIKLKAKIDENTYLNYIACLLFFVIILLFISYILYIKKKKQNENIKAKRRENFLHEQFIQSKSFIEENRKKIIELNSSIEKLTNKNERLKLELDKERLKNMNNMANIKIKYKIQSEENLYNSEIYKKIRMIYNNKTSKQDFKLSPDDWNELDKEVNKHFPKFRERITEICRISNHEYHICLLLKINIQPTNIAKLTHKSDNAISSTRKRLYERAFGVAKSPKEWDQYIYSL